jgi:putative ABC transport system ATP-binding protein
MMLAGIPAAERAQRVAQALKDFGLDQRAGHRPDQLSGGQRQRVAIARATIMQPAVLLADEPTGNLDRATGDEVIHLLEVLNERGMTLIVVTHDPKIGMRARRQLMMEDGALKSDSKQDNPPGPLSGMPAAKRNPGYAERGGDGGSPAAPAPDAPAADGPAAGAA